MLTIHGGTGWSSPNPPFGSRSRIPAEVHCIADPGEKESRFTAFDQRLSVLTLQKRAKVVWLRDRWFVCAKRKRRGIGEALVLLSPVAGRAHRRKGLASDAVVIGAESAVIRKIRADQVIEASGLSVWLCGLYLNEGFPIRRIRW
jgi:hypothetical protein